MLGGVARMIDAATRSFVPLEPVTRSMVHTHPTAAKATGPNIRIRVGGIGIDDGFSHCAVPSQNVLAKSLLPDKDGGAFTAAWWQHCLSSRR
jgi:hypothetical protein